MKALLLLLVILLPGCSASTPRSRATTSRDGFSAGDSLGQSLQQVDHAAARSTAGGLAAHPD